MSGYADRVQETSSTAGTGTLTTSGTAPAGYQTLATAFPATSTNIDYGAYDTSGNWEVGHGIFTVSGSTLTRPAANVTAGSSGAGVNVSFSGTVTVFCTLPAARIIDMARACAFQNRNVPQ